MTGIDDRIEEMRELVRNFAPTNGLMNRRVPETEDIHKLACSLREVLSWIKEHDDRQSKSNDRRPRARRML